MMRANEPRIVIDAIRLSLSNMLFICALNPDRKNVLQLKHGVSRTAEVRERFAKVIPREKLSELFVVKLFDSAKSDQSSSTYPPSARLNPVM